MLCEVKSISVRNFVKIHRVTSIYYKGSKIHDIYASLHFSFIFHEVDVDNNGTLDLSEIFKYIYIYIRQDCFN